eukprot:SAG11_NODE_8627_length_994_cov_1.055866_2_plen_167_part_00
MPTSANAVRGMRATVRPIAFDDPISSGLESIGGRALVRGVTLENFERRYKCEATTTDGPNGMATIEEDNRARQALLRRDCERCGARSYARAHGHGPSHFLRCCGCILSRVDHGCRAAGIGVSGKAATATAATTATDAAVTASASVPGLRCTPPCLRAHECESNSAR